MDVSNLLARDTPQGGGDGEVGYHSRQYPTRHSFGSQEFQQPFHTFAGSMGSPTKIYSGPADAPRPSPGKSQKHVTFELLLPEAQHRARLPMRVMISPHDTTESIITTVRNFYGLYEGPGVSFEDRAGNTLIATYENFEHNMFIFVRMTAPDPAVAEVNTRSRSVTTSPRKPQLGAPFEMRPPAHSMAQYASRPDSRNAHGRSMSPQSSRSHRSMSTALGAKSRSRSHKARDASAHGDAYADGYSDSDGGDGSVSSRREPHASAEISVNNIVEGGRRKRAKFDSSELPLFVPPQVPATNSISSVSPQRRVNGDAVASPFSWSNQRTFAYPQPMPSPQSYGRADAHMLGQYGGAFGEHSGPQPRTRGPTTYGPPRQSTGGILPTPEPTVGSVISDEDVALQLMRLGDASNFSSHGRTSTSTVDDALSGKAEAASSDGEGDDEDEELPIASRVPRPVHDRAVGPRRRKQRMLNDTVPSTDSVQSSGDEYDDASFKGESDEVAPEMDSRTLAKAKMPGRGSVSSFNGSIKSAKSRLPGAVKSKAKTSGATKVPMSPASLPSQSRKASLASTINFQHQLGIDEEDLSSKPRCQRCRKSKKGCDRQRPCGRCKDAGIGADGCLSEDEGNGRKGRYGRHMGVPVKKASEESLFPVFAASHPPGEFLTPAAPTDKSKKRKR
ncbi:hypothetical protein MBLNU459_g1204t1 [Dothideomycetes sp. NU459]